MKYQIRPVEAADAQDINALRRMLGVMENILALPSERLEDSQRFLQQLDANQHQFVAEVTQEDGTQRVVAMAGLMVNSRPRLRHSGGIGIMVHRDYQHQGIGRALMETLLDIADNWLRLVRVELEVYTDNEKAIALYHKMGFEAEGVKRKASIRNGKYADELLMARIQDTL